MQQQGLHNRIFTIGAFAVITNEKGEYLLVQRRDNNKWVTPGGGVESGESPQQVVAREVKEESGFDVEVESLVMLMSKAWEDDLVLVFRCKIVGGKASLNDEAQAIEFFAVDNLPEPMHLRHRDIILECAKETEKVVLKHYQTDEELVLQMS